jgi:predicted dinucleotide-binding enzyme
MKIGIVGSGNVGLRLGRIWLNNGHHIMFSHSRDKAKLDKTVENLGTNASTGSPSDAVAYGDVVVLSVPWSSVTDALRAAGSLAGKILFSTVKRAQCRYERPRPEKSK